ncbi:MAG: hypothetical protein VYD64_00265, partial [Pseudomonadota bacterium]|nr:hypothetical protein [Pseudomonadota bacterium]
EEVLPALRKLKLSKYCDFNFLNLVHDMPGKSTFEVRILPGMADAGPIVDRAGFFEAMLRWCLDRRSGQVMPADLVALIGQFGLAPDRRTRWMERASALQPVSRMRRMFGAPRG